MPAPVIVVHNEDHVRQAAMQTLRNAGHECAGFADPMAALDAIEDTSRVRVLVTRVNFGEGVLNGVAFARMLRVKRPATKVVFIARPEYEQQAAALGSFGPRPFDAAALVEAVGRALANTESDAGAPTAA